MRDINAVHLRSPVLLATVVHGLLLYQPHNLGLVVVCGSVPDDVRVVSPVTLANCVVVMRTRVVFDDFIHVKPRQRWVERLFVYFKRLRSVLHPGWRLQVVPHRKPGSGLVVPFLDLVITRSLPFARVWDVVWEIEVVHVADVPIRVLCTCLNNTINARITMLVFFFEDCANTQVLCVSEEHFVI